MSSPIKSESPYRSHNADLGKSRNQLALTRRGRLARNLAFIATGIAVGVSGTVATEHFHNRNHIVSQLERPSHDVEQEINADKIDMTKVKIVDAPITGVPFDEATAILKEFHKNSDPRELEDIISAQVQNNTVNQGGGLYLPKSDLTK